MSERVPIETACREAFAEVIAPRPHDAARLESMVASALAPASTAVAGSSASALGRGGLVVIAVALGGALAWGLGRDMAPGPATVAPIVRGNAAEPSTAPAPEIVAPTPEIVAPTPEIVAPTAEIDAPVVRTAPVVDPPVRPRSAARERDTTPPTADALLERANAARRRGEFDVADALYGELERTHPISRAANVGRISHGRLLARELRRPDAAVAAFTAYLAQQPEGNLAEEARVGRARALEAAGRSDEARDAWAELLREHPTSLHADAARRALAD